MYVCIYVYVLFQERAASSDIPGWGGGPLYRGVCYCCIGYERYVRGSTYIHTYINTWCHTYYHHPGPVLFFDFWTVLICFLVLEAMVGMFNSSGATLRSRLVSLWCTPYFHHTVCYVYVCRYYPESMHSSIMSVFRLPLNILVVIGTKLTDKAANPASLQAVFKVLVGMHAFAFLLQVALLLITSRSGSSNKGKRE